MTEWTQAELTIARLLVQEGKDAQQISDALAEAGVRRTHQAVRRLLQRKREREAGWHALVAESPFPRHDQPLKVEGNALCLFDPQAPFQDSAWINRCVALALGYGIEQLILGGDVVDLVAFSPFGARPTVSFAAEKAATAQMLDAFVRNFARVWWVSGNHEDRLARKTGGYLSAGDVLGIWTKAPNLEITEYRWCELVSSGERFYIEHPGSFSKRATTVGFELAAIHECHVICGHGHLWGMTRDASNKHWVVDAGLCADPVRLEYAQKVHKRFPKQVQGAVLVLDGIPLLVAPHNIKAYERGGPAGRLAA